MLNISQLSVFYGKIQVLHQVSLRVKQGEIVTVIGSNGAGKSTFLNSIAGVNSNVSGSIEYKGMQILKKLPEDIVKLGISLVCQGGRLFRRLTVLENLELGTYLRSKSEDIKRDMAGVFEIFPPIEHRLKWPAGKLSGGEQQMLAISRCLMANPHLMMMDEPSFGLSPLMVKEVVRVIRKLRDQAKTILLVEQNARMALRVAQHAYILETGKLILGGSAAELAKDDRVRKSYLGES